LNSVESWVKQKTDLDDKTTKHVNKSIEDARQIEAQDVEAWMVLKAAVKLPRIDAFQSRIRICVMVVKAAVKKFDGYKRHILKDLELQMVRAVGVTKANEPEAYVTTAIEEDLNAQQLTTKDIKELHIDRAYLVSHWVKQRTSDMTILCKAWKVRNDKF